MPSTPPDARAYWEERLEERFSLDGVGWQGLGESFNRWMYAVRRQVFLSAVRAAGGSGPRARVLDVGSGTGFYLERWRELGVAAPEASDLTETATRRLAASFPASTVRRLDIGGPAAELPRGGYEAISAMDMLFHIVDDDAYRRAYLNLGTLLAPGGLLVFSENFLRGPTRRSPSQVSHGEGEILTLLREAGFEPTLRRPMFVLMNAPVDPESRALARWWSFVSRVASGGEALGWVAGAATYPLERALVASMRRGPSTELMVCRRALS